MSTRADVIHQLCLVCRTLLPEPLDDHYDGHTKGEYLTALREAAHHAETRRQQSRALRRDLAKAQRNGASA